MEKTGKVRHGTQPKGEMKEERKRMKEEREQRKEDRNE